MTKTVVASQKTEREPLVSEAVWAVDIRVTHAGQVWGEPGRLQVESTYTQELYDRVLT